MSSSESMLVFRVGGLWLAVPSAAVLQIHASQEPTPVPLAPEHVAGIVNLRGEVVPLVDLVKLLEVGEAGEEGRGRAFVRIAVVTAGGMRVGLLCHEVRGVLKLERREEAGGRVVSGRILEQVSRGELVSDGTVIVELDIEALLEAARVTS